MPIAHTTAETGAKTAVFVHGSPGDHRVWEPLIKAAPDHVRCVALDLPDHGSAPEESTERLEALEADVAAVVRAERAPVVLVGQSLGAYLAARLLPELGEAVSHAVLLSGFPSLPPPVLEGRGALIQGLESGQVTGEAFGAMALDLFLGPPPRAPEHERMVREMIESVDTERLLRALRRGNGAGDPGREVQPYDTPAIVIHDADDPAIPHQLGAALARLGARTELVTIEDGKSHLPQVTRTDEVARWVFA